MSEAEALVRTLGLKKYYQRSKKILKVRDTVQAVDDVNLSIDRGETLGIVGESGCGKSTLGRTILRLIEPTGGDILFKGRSLLALAPEEMRQLRRRIQIIFQDPYATLNPKMTVQETIRSPLDVFDLYSKRDREQKVLEIMGRVGLGRHLLHRYPHEFSGGQRQRIVIGRALIINPEFIVCDEPVSALDVSIRSQVINLMREIQEEFNLTYMFISHDLSVVRYMSDRIAVMYLGKIVELTEKKLLFDTPFHPYTQALISAIPVPDVDYRQERIILEGDVPSPINSPSGCKFHTRCPYAMEKCSVEEPELIEVSESHMVACHLFSPLPVSVSEEIHLKT